MLLDLYMSVFTNLSSKPCLHEQKRTSFFEHRSSTGRRGGDGEGGRTQWRRQDQVGVHWESHESGGERGRTKTRQE